MLKSLEAIEFRIGELGADDLSSISINSTSEPSAPQSLGRITFLSPEVIPGTDEILAALPNPARDECVLATVDPRRPFTASIAGLSALLPVSATMPSVSFASQIALDQAADARTHDQFFHIERAGHSHPAGYLRSLFEARAAYDAELAQAPVSIDMDAIDTIHRGINAALAAALGLPLPPRSSRTELPPTAVVRVDPARRWIRGHQIFAALTQGLIFTTSALSEAVERADTAGRGAAADLFAVLLDASAATFRLTGDFAPDDYNELIRPSMAEPNLPRGFTGLLSFDHRLLVRRMKAGRPAMHSLRDADPERHAAIVASLTGVYDSHRLVCSQFVGADQSSLLMGEDAQRSSLDHIERLKANRLGSIA